MKRWTAVGLAFSIAAAACSSGPDDSSGPPVATVADGALQGSRPADAPGAVFQGIPFAQPPVGSLRWAPPRPALAWQGTKTATAYASSCVQTFDGVNVSGSEDCLYLNVCSA
ncbi:carboxylesterase family protein [Caballeronia sp. LZ025]|uniref:carboxylesterase family protein n=1 Tax=Caballeronia TaxID=1827195 RepID=UPI00285C48AE|nr:carboxylesterase family protein [Caballeronia sp. LZ025]MDR5734033.1 carboxylesterase family protein [Caballeronia sp. LZ025]